MDDTGIHPTAPIIPTEPEIDGNDLAAEIDKETARAYFHPAWIEVEKMFVEAIELATYPVDPKLPADEYKIEALSNFKVKAKLTEILQRVANAVSAVEAQPRNRTRGGQ